MTDAGSQGSRPIRAVSLDFWDTIYTGAATPERVSLRRRAVGDLLAAYGKQLPPEEVERLYHEAGREADRWWREEHRGYTTTERLNLLLHRAELIARDGCEHVAACARAVDDALETYPPPLLPGARELVERLAARFPLVIVSDTGFASGAAQDRLLARDGILDLFVARIYSADVGWAKPRPEPFDAAVQALADRGIGRREIVHVGDIERTDVAGALAAGMRAIRLDVVRQSGPSAAEHVAVRMAEVGEYVEERRG